MKHELKDERGLASLPVALDWQEWWKVHGPVIAEHHGKAGWILLLLDSIEKIEELEVLLSRLIRNKPEYDSAGWTQKEWLNCEEVTAEALAWFERHAKGVMRDGPDWSKFLFSALHGSFSVLARLGREQRALMDQGYLVATIERGEKISLGGDAQQVLAECD